ncbi:putative uncharacterized protein [Waddlia chondrophila 2032/99]|uniref:Uncharacterized protein n=2 Tax=Waddlia chondrophila TaxID=71667 RepID=D6YSE8_WADCW|nr:hypothetical protein [Waddlia chondrophila]ADI38993.1 conserved hypothetical protein [Waddlia chondrophila WSU 86-1044]CCB92114.1 putative uncharacterized protein [Waddlia chondrophila 2032/99]
MPIFRTLFILAALTIGFWTLWEHHSTFREIVQTYVENGEFLTLEARYSADQIMQAHEKELIPDAQYSYQDPALKFYPYLLMEVKYTQQGRTREGVILWSMVDGEMVLDTDSWEKTHGFEDAINAGANRSDFVLINTLAKYRGSLSSARLQKELNLDDQAFNQLIENSRKKYLIIIRGNEVALHFQNPNFLVPPQTRINQWLVTKPYHHAIRVGKRYSQKQIEKVAKAAFGYDFTVRSAKEVFLPVYSIEVLNPDGSILTSYWNALNGHRIDNKYLSLSP